MTDWNARYQAGDTPWEKGMAAPPLLELLERTGSGIWGEGKTLVPGCGTGHDVRALAKAGASVIGVDLAEEAISRAQESPKAAEERYLLADFLEPSFRQEHSFTSIWEHTCFCAIDPSRRDDYASACAELIATGGHLNGVFFLNPQEPGEEDQGPPFNSSIEELDARFSPWFDRVDSWVPQCTYPGREGKEWLAIYRRR